MKLDSLPYFSLTFIIIVLLFQLYESAYADDMQQQQQLYLECKKPFSCGPFLNLSYPFSASPSSYCGYPGFDMSCSSDDLPSDDLPSDDLPMITSLWGYSLLSVNPDQHIFTVVINNDWFDELITEMISSIPTSMTITNTSFGSIDTSLFNFTARDENTTLYYECSNSSSTKKKQFLGTNITGSNGIYYDPVRKGYIVPSHMESTSHSLPLNTCKHKIWLPLSTEYMKSTIFRYAIELHWKTNNSLCRGCQGSGGACGYNSATSEFACFCPYHAYKSGDTKCPASPTHTLNKKYRVARAGLILGCSAVGICMIVLLACCFKRRFSSGSQDVEIALKKYGSLTLKRYTYMSFLAYYFKRRFSSDSQDVEVVLNKYGSLTLKRYTFRSLKNITNSFKDKLGEGGYGTVYRGKLRNGHHVAVKFLKKTTNDVEEFVNELTTIGRTNHKNVVTLLGFCFEGQRRALVYDFMPNGSLEKFLHRNCESQTLPWDKLFEIAVGIAGGLKYLHQGCNARIVHFDIKPHNILLDEDFRPKISDFGLAKSSKHKDCIISMCEARGTVGFIAPEVFFTTYGGVSNKSDVYSYGMLVLDMVGCRQNANADYERSSEQYFPHWIYRQLEQIEEPDQQEILNREANELQRKMIIVSLWCIQTNPSSRPAMSRVVEMLEGPLESLEIPPMPSLSSPPMSNPNFSLKASYSSYSYTTSSHLTSQTKQL